MLRSNFTSSAALLIAAVACASGCVGDLPVQHHGLDSVHLYVDSADLSKLSNGTYTKTSAAADVVIAGDAFVGELSYAGRSSVDDLKKSFNVELSRPYEGRTEYRLNAMSRDPSALKTMLSFRVFDLIGTPTPQRRYVSVSLNGEPIGVYILQDKIDEAFFRARGQVATRIYAARDTRATMEMTAGVATSFTSRVGPDLFGDLERLVALINDEPSTDNRRELERYLDVDSVLVYMAASTFIGNNDGIDNNYILARTREEPQFSMLAWDLDFTFRTTTARDDGGLFARNAMMRRFFHDDPDYRLRYDRYLVGLGVAVEDGDLDGYLTELATTIAEAYANDRVLSRYPDSLDDQAETIRTTIARQIALLIDRFSLLQQSPP